MGKYNNNLIRIHDFKARVDRTAYILEVLKTEEGYAIIVESTGNVWRLEEACFHTSLATFGAHLTDGQRHILDRSGALSLIVLTDPDEAGRIAAKGIRKSCGNSYKIYEPKIGQGDIADNEVEVIKAKLSPVIKQVKKDLGI